MLIIISFLNFDVLIFTLRTSTAHQILRFFLTFAPMAGQRRSLNRAEKRGCRSRSLRLAQIHREKQWLGRVDENGFFIGEKLFLFRGRGLEG